jgi:hypothetical protein
MCQISLHPPHQREPSERSEGNEQEKKEGPNALLVPGTYIVGKGIMRCPGKKVGKADECPGPIALL